MIENPQIDNTSVSFAEIWGALWSHKFYIAIITGIVIFLAGYYVVTAEKKYTATAIFEIQQQNSANLSISGELGALASIAGLTKSGSADTKILLERLVGREFILNSAKMLNLKNDPYFNTFNVFNDDNSWKAKIKKFIGLESRKPSPDLIIEKMIIDKYIKNVEVTTTKAGAISISVTHENPDTAAEYSNALMEQTRKLVEFEEKAASERRLVYLSATLADALEEIETAQQRLKNFALNNSARAQESFLSGSLRLDGLRMERKKSQEILSTLTIVKNMVEKKDTDSNSYSFLKANHPLVDDVEFRRILGMSETISAWAWPSLGTLQAVSATLKDRIQRLNVDISEIESDAQIYALSAEKLASLTREAKIAEATYTVLIEQVKSQALAAGFKPDSFRVFEYATTPLAPSSPIRNLTLLLSAILGLLIGVILTIFNALKSGVLYSQHSIQNELAPIISLPSYSIRRLSRKSISKITDILRSGRNLAADEADISLHNKKLIYVLNLGGRPTASGVARVLAAQNAISGRKILLCDTTGLSSETKQSFEPVNNSDLTIDKFDENLDLLHGYSFKNALSFFTTKNFKSTIEKLVSSYDRVYISTGNREALAGLAALVPFDTGVVVITRKSKTKKSDLARLKKLKKIGVLFNG